MKIPENLTRQSYRLIRDEILRGQLDKQRHLTEGFFAARYAISKSPIREALNVLESEGLIKIEPRRGVSVRRFSIQDIAEIYELREVLEALVVRKAELAPKLLERMRQAVRVAEAYRGKGDKLAYLREDAAFHAALTQACGNGRLRRALKNMRDQILILRRQTFELSSGTSVKQHYEILAALENGDREQAARLMAQHVHDVRTRLINHLREHEKRSAAGKARPGVKRLGAHAARHLASANV
jgi:DNA-binding GntR family transcriptional regulator